MNVLSQLSLQTAFTQLNFNQLLSQYGFIDFVLPFLLIFSLVFMLLELSNLLKVSSDDAVGRKLSAIFSFGFALLSIYNQNLVKWLLSFIPNATIAIIGFTLIVIVLAITNKKVPGILRAFFAFLVVGIILWLAINSLSITGSTQSSPLTPLLSYTLNYLMQSGILTLLIMFLLIFIVLMWIAGGGEKKTEEEEEKIGGPILLRSR